MKMPKRRCDVGLFLALLPSNKSLTSRDDITSIGGAYGVMGRCRKHGAARRRRVADRKYGPAVWRGGGSAPRADLPAELWDIVLSYCRPIDYRAIAGSWSTLRALVLRQAETAVDRVRREMDAACDAWEVSTPFWDATHPLCFRHRHDRPCKADGHREHKGEDQKTEDAGDEVSPHGRGVWICHEYEVRGLDYAYTICEACEAYAAEVDPDRTRWPRRWLDFEIPHVWTNDEYALDAGTYMASTVPARFVVPRQALFFVAARGLLSHGVFSSGDQERSFPRLLARSAALRWRWWYIDFLGDLTPSRLPSVRAWLPLGPADAVRAPASIETPRYMRRTTAMRYADDAFGECFWMVCCDADHPMWGAVVLVYRHGRPSMTWIGPWPRPRFHVAKEKQTQHTRGPPFL
jgi:hypothetical protein